MPRRPLLGSGLAPLLGLRPTMLTHPSPSRRVWNLALATLTFAVTFWAWALLSPLAPAYQDDLDLSGVATSVLTAVPVLVGSLGRVPVGVLTDRYGGRAMFTVVSAASIVPVVFLANADGLVQLLAGGVVLGLAGTSFAVGMPFVTAWFPPERRGMATGVFGAGMGGTAVSALATPRLADASGRESAFWIVVAALVVVTVLCAVTMRNAPAWTPRHQSLRAGFGGALRLPATWMLCGLYAVTFGGYVALSTYLPTYLRVVYDESVTDAATEMAGFVAVAVICRPAGGFLSDRYGPDRILGLGLAVVAVFAVAAAFEAPIVPWATIAFLALAGGVGLSAGATFAMVPRLVPADQVGAVSGVVGAAGGLGGFFPPILMGVVYEGTGSYAIGLMLLADVALAALVYVAVGRRPAARVH